MSRFLIELSIALNSSYSRSHLRKPVPRMASGSGDGAAPWSPPILVSGTVLYGTTHGGGGTGHGTLYQIDQHGKETVLHSFGPLPDGQRPVAKLLFYDDTLYGTTAHGGENNAGTVFSLTP